MRSNAINNLNLFLRFIKKKLGVLLYSLITYFAAALLILSLYSWACMTLMTRSTRWAIAKYACFETYSTENNNRTDQF